MYCIGNRMKLIMLCAMCDANQPFILLLQKGRQMQTLIKYLSYVAWNEHRFNFSVGFYIVKFPKKDVCSSNC